MGKDEQRLTAVKCQKGICENIPFTIHAQETACAEQQKARAMHMLQQSRQE